MPGTRRIIRICVISAAAIAAALLLLLFFHPRSVNRYDSLRDRVVTAEPVSEDTEETVGGDYVSPIDFDELQAINPDIYAWIEIPGTDISYPVLQDDEDINTYLQLAYDGSRDSAGSVFSGPGTSRDLTDFNTILYGHNMANGSMFGRLKSYRDSSWFSEHREIIVYTPSSEHTYEVFGAVVYSDVLLTYAYDFRSPEDCQGFLDSLRETGNPDSRVMTDVTVTPDDHVLTLSTCTSSDTQRYLVVAVETAVRD